MVGSSGLLQARSVASCTATRSSGAPSSFPLSRSRRRGYPYLCTILVEQNVSKTARGVYRQLKPPPLLHPICRDSKMSRVCSEAEVKALIGIWVEGYIQKELDGLVRNKEIYKNLASDYKNRAMTEMGTM